MTDFPLRGPSAGAGPGGAEDHDTETAVNRQCRRAREAAVCLGPLPWFFASIAGPDRKTFLHGMLSNEVKNLSPGEGNHTLFLTPKGKILADLWLFDRGDDLLLMGPNQGREATLAGLGKYLIMEEAEIHDITDSYEFFHFFGPLSDERFEDFFESVEIPKDGFGWSMTEFAGAPAEAVRMGLLGTPGYGLLVPPGKADSLRNAPDEHGFEPAGTAAFETLRVEAGAPALGRELDETVIPQEAGLYEALSFEKGCYVGQEVVARLHFRGHVNRQLTGFALDAGEVPAGELTLTAEGKTVGKMTSSVYSPTLDRVIGLGYLKVSLREPGTRLTALAGDTPVCEAEVRELPHVPPGNS